jgi:alpha-1,3-mannosyltransferase
MVPDYAAGNDAFAHASTGPDAMSIVQSSPSPPRRPLRILHVCRRYLPFMGGTERYVRDVATAQADLGHQVTVLTLDRGLSRDPRVRLPTEEVTGAVRVVRIPGWGTRQFSLAFRPDVIARAVRDHDVVHLHDVRFHVGLVAATARIFGRAWLMHTHGLVFHEARGSALKHLAVRAYYAPLFSAGGAMIIASSETDRRRLLADAPWLAPRVRTFTNALPLQRLFELPRAPIAGHIISIGRVARSKGIDDLLAALAQIPETDWTLDIAGAADEEESKRLHRLAEAAGLSARVRFTGPFEDRELGKLLQSAAAAAFPSRGEGFGLALLEAMAAGVPLVARDILAHAELLGSDLGELIVDFDRPAEAAARIRGLLGASREEAAQLSARLRNRAAAYDLSRLIGQLEGLYRELGLLHPT